MATPNENGVYVDFETIKHRTKSGASAGIYVVETPDGWRTGYDLNYSQGGGGCFPSMHGKAYTTREAAVDAEMALLRKRVACIGISVSYGETRVAQEKAELLDWIDLSTRQMELFS